MTKARSLADLMADGNSLADGVVSVAEVSGAAPLASPSFTGDISVTGTVDGRDVAADGTKLDGVEVGATADQSASDIRSLVEAATDSNVFTDADHIKLDGVEAGADVTDTANVVGSLTAGSNITIAADGTIAGAAQYTHPTHPGDDASVDTGVLSGATVISDLDFNITTDTDGHVTDANASVATRTLTLTDLGYTGATNANYITNNNQLSNGAGYTTNVGDITNVSAGTNLTGGGSSGSVTVNLAATPNITSLNVGGSEVISNSRALKNIASVDATTAASIGAAGVGGGLTYLGRTNITSDVAYFEYTFATGYDIFYIVLENLMSTYNGIDAASAKFTGSGSSLSSTEYTYFHDYTGTIQNRSSIDEVMKAGTSAGNIGPSYRWTIVNPLAANQFTLFEMSGGGGISNNSNDALLDNVQDCVSAGATRTQEVNSRIRFYTIGGVEYFNGWSSKTLGYSVWGIKNA